jgi:hypothetical protein
MSFLHLWTTTLASCQESTLLAKEQTLQTLTQSSFGTLVAKLVIIKAKFNRNFENNSFPVAWQY